MNSKADIFRKCFNGKMRSIPKFNEFNKVSNLFLYSYIQNIISANAFKNKRYLMSENTIIKKFFNQEFLTCSFNLPDPNKVHKGGEDSYLIFKDLLVVADGVGGWKDHGIDPAIYPKFLCDNLKNLYDIYYKENENNSNTSDLLDEKRLKNFIVEATKKTNLMGSSTLCAILIDNKRNCLYSAYIGDSVYMILRYKEGKYSKLFKSKDLSHKFNHPFQLGLKGDDPEKSIIARHDLDINDIIILATDGLWDNVHDIEIEAILNDMIKKFENVKGIGNNQIFLNKFTEKLSSRAVKNSLNKKIISPFSLKARSFNLLKIGGKQDDITIIVAFIQEKINIKSFKETFIKHAYFNKNKKNEKNNDVLKFIDNFNKINLSESLDNVIENKFFDDEN